MAWTTKPLGGGVKSLVVRPLKKPLFYVCLPLRPHLKEEMNCKQGPSVRVWAGTQLKKIFFFSFTYSELSPKNRFYSVTNRGIVPT